MMENLDPGTARPRRPSGTTRAGARRRCQALPATAAVAILLAFFAPAPVRAQELEPRAYSPAPVGTNFFLATYSYQWGDILFDTSLPVSEVRAYLSGAAGGYGRAFSIAGKTATVALVVPYAWGSASGNVADQSQKVWRSGLGDTRLRFVMNLVGGPALTPREFAARTPTTSVGASLVVVAPTGQYDSLKLVNIGTNRWAFKPDLGISHPIGRWTLEASAGVWLFMDNRSKYPGEVVYSQDPLASFQAHIGYTVRPGLWIAGDATYYTGGQTYSDGVPGDTRQSNSRLGLTASTPVARGHTIKLSFASGVTSRVGSRFDTVGFAYQYTWFD